MQAGDFQLYEERKEKKLQEMTPEQGNLEDKKTVIIKLDSYNLVI